MVSEPRESLRSEDSRGQGRTEANTLENISDDELQRVIPEAMRKAHVIACADVTTVVHGDFEWDDAKAAANLHKHGVSFVEAATVFEDVDLLVNADPRARERFVAVGFSAVARVLVVVHAMRSERTRLISARRATLREEQLYAERSGR